MRLLKELFEVHKELNPQLFENDKLRDEIRLRLLEIADMFVESIQEDNIPIKVYDYWLVGSNASYNYTQESDIDVHIIVHIEAGVKAPVIRLLYDYIKSNFNDKYKITIKGHEVELYIEDVKSTAITNGIYSLKKDEWVKFPKKQEPRVVEIENTKLYKDTLKKYNSLSDEECEQFLDDLYVMRKISLANDGEFGEGNLVFKQFRNDGLLQELKDRKYKFKSKELSLESLQN